VARDEPRSRLTHLLDLPSHAASLVWRSLFATAAGMCAVAGLMDAVGRHGDAYAFVLIAGGLGAVASAAGLLALRVESPVDPYDPPTPTYKEAAP